MKRSDRVSKLNSHQIPRIGGRFTFGLEFEVRSENISLNFQAEFTPNFADSCIPQAGCLVQFSKWENVSQNFGAGFTIHTRFQSPDSRDSSSFHSCPGLCHSQTEDLKEKYQSKLPSQIHKSR